MESVFTWIGIALAALIGVAVSVAAWEHHRLVTALRQARSQLPLSSQPAAAAAQAPLAASVDVDVDAFTEPPSATSPGDSADRRTTLEQAMGRLSREPAAAQTKAAASAPVSWVDTEPMIGPGVPDAPSRSPSKAPSA